MKSGTVWYISKYCRLPLGDEAGGRGYELMRELVAQGGTCVLFISDSSHLYEVPTFKGAYFIEDRDGVTVCWIRTLKFTRAHSLRRVLSWISFEWGLLCLRKSAFPRPDVVVASSLSLLSVISGVAFKTRYRARFVFEVRDIWPLTLLELGSWSARHPLMIALGLVERLGYAKADVIVGTMPNLGEHVESILGRPKETACIPMGVAERTLNSASSLPEGFFDTYVPANRFVVGYAGTFGVSNQLEVIYAAAELLQEDPGIHFVLVGGGDLLAEHKAAFSSLANLTFAPRVSHDMVGSFLERCDLLVFATEAADYWRFGQSLNKLVDYMLSGTPVVASYSGYPSMLDEAGSGSFVPAGDAQALADEIRRFAGTPASELKEMGERGRRWFIENRTYSALAREYVSLLFPGPSLGTPSPEDHNR